MKEMLREKGATKVFKMKLTSRLPAAKSLFSVTSNKIHIQIIYFIIDDLLNHNDDEVAHSLILTGPEYLPYELVGNNLLIRREDIQTTQEEADNIIIQQMGQKKTVLILVIGFYYCKQ